MQGVLRPYAYPRALRHEFLLDRSRSLSKEYEGEFQNGCGVLRDSTALPKTYDAATVEPRLYAEWEAAGLFHDEPDPARPPFIIAMPPPNITGRAHLGHASTYTAMDVLTRYHRMRGENATWIPGLDHAAIATEAVLVRDLAKRGHSRESLGREAFLAEAWSWHKEYGGIINQQFRRLGFGADWQRERFTLDEGLSAAVNRAFVLLYREGLIYRGRRLITWDPVAHSTLSDAEIEYEQRDGSLWHIRYRAEDGGEGLVVATTRPETMLGDTAVAVHPDDERYRALIGTRLRLPLTDRLIPVIADAAVEPTFGTGAVKVTPAHDPTDYEIGLRHDLPMPTILDLDGCIASDDPDLTGDLTPFAGLDRFAAREAIVAAIEASGALVATEAYRHNVALSSRSHAVVEPLLSLQWFVRMEPLAAPALEAYRAGRLRFIPERHGRTYEQWLTQIRDWNISRQVWWGHRLPVWYTPDDAVIVAETEEEARRIAHEQYDDAPLRRDDDTLDTWFSSGLWPFSILGWPQQTPELAHWYPTNTLITAREIIFLWVARMAMLGLHFVGELPFHDVLITPLVFDEQGRKMSKSLGNAIDPIDLIARYGADATRFGILRQMHLESQELRFSESRCAEASRFATKIWNALQYVCHLPEGLPAAGSLPSSPTLAERWLLTDLARTVERAEEALNRYDLGAYAELLLDFLWYRLCDWGIEASKVATPTRAGVLSYVLNTAMRLMHPIAPFLTEAVWQALPHDGATIVTASWPDVAEIPQDAEAHATFEALIVAVGRVRAFRAEMGLKPHESIEVRSAAPLPDELVTLFAALARADLSVVGDAAGSPIETLTTLTIRADAAVVRPRLEKELARIDAELTRSRARLANAAFLAKATVETVESERRKVAEGEAQQARIHAHLEECR